MSSLKIFSYGTLQKTKFTKDKEKKNILLEDGSSELAWVYLLNHIV